MEMSQNYLLITKIGAIAISLSLPLTIVESSQAVVFVHNLSEPSAGSVLANSSDVFGSSFTIDSNNYTLNSITVPLGELNEGSFSINLHTDNTGEPGTIIENLITIEDILPGGLNNYLFTPVGNVNLSSNTTYWLTNSVVDPGLYDWGFTNSLNQTSPGAWTIGDEVVVSRDGGVSWDPPVPGFAMQFNVDADVASVPFEFSPTMGILFISGVFGLKTVYGRYKANKVRVED